MKPPIVAALEEQLGCYRKLLKLSDAQRDYVRNNQTDELLKVLQARSDLLTDIARLEKEVAPLKRAWADHSAAFPPLLKETTSRMLAETKALLEQITQADQDDVLLLQQRQMNVGKQIQQTQSARRVNTRYAASAYATPQGTRLNVKQ